ncbi:hypothetical protein C4J91_5246 [Pseudomonas sp. R3-52-08]|nr:hypothetical protein C4J91_5246 [Pseudomonas sp. R3-52-08]
MGGGLLPIAVRQLPNTFLTDRYRGQAPSHMLSTFQAHKQGFFRPFRRPFFSPGDLFISYVFME